MTQPKQATLQCSNCGTPNAVVMRRVVDVQRDPQGKNALLSGQINQFQCQNCGMVNSVSSPLLYHDATKEMLIAFVPMDVAMKQGTNEEQMVGQLMNELTATIPKEELPLEFMMNALRLNEGVPRDYFADRTGLSFAVIKSNCDKLVALELLENSEITIQPTRKGHQFLNSVLEYFSE